MIPSILLVLSPAVSPAGGEVLLENLGLACAGDVVLSGPFLGVLVDEAAAGGVDRNGDGDADDLVLHVVDTDRGQVVNTHIATLVQRVTAEGSSFVVLATEAAGGRDLNGDGDLLDTVPVAYDAQTSQVHSTGLATAGQALVVRDGRLFQPVRESAQGSGDLNGDGDALDAVLYPARLRFAEPRSRSFGADVGRGPSLEVLGEAAPPRELVVQVRHALPRAPGVLLVGLEPDAVPLFGGTLFVAPPFLAVAPFTGVRLGLDEFARVSLGALPPELASTTLILQAAVVDASVPGGIGLGPGLRVRIGG